jgi:succinyl-CoA synthetase beta subunit
VAAADEVGYPVVVKAQVQVGGRGKAGGVKLAANADECRTHASNILGMDIKGHTVKVVWIEHASDIATEYYASFTLDRSAKAYFGMLSAQGGVEIEAVADSDPDAIAKIHVDPVAGLTEEQCRSWVTAAKLDPAVTDQTVELLMKLYRAYVDGDADLVEINPLIVTPQGKVHALDAKVSLDNNAAFRHEWAEYEATQERDDREEAAHAADLQYVGLDGSVGIIANGAGLAMSTLDVVNQVGGSAANFLDVGGGADAKKFVSALTIIDNDPRVRSIFINIFGGITRGEEVANGIITALSQIDIKSPIVIRLDGTNADEGRAILEPHLGDTLQMAPTMLDAARTAVALAAR